MANFKISASPGGALTAANTATGDLFPVVDVDVGASDNANKYMTAAELRKLMDRLRVDGTVKTPPLAADIGTTWSWVNQGSTSATQDDQGNLSFTKPRTASDSVSLLVRTLPSTPYTVTMEIDWLGPTSNYAGFGIAMRDSSSGRICGLPWVNADTTLASLGGMVIAAPNYTNATTYNSGNATLVPTAAPVAKPPRFIRVTDSGTNVQLYISEDGITFITTGSAASRTSFLATPDQIGFGVNSIQTVSYGWGTNCNLTVRDFRIA